MKKRILSLLLAMCLVIGLLPVIALAEDAAPVEATSTLTVTTGNNDAVIQWKPELAEGMAPVYAKTTAEGALVLEGATAADYNLKAEWPVGGKPTLTMKGATLANDTINPDDKDGIEHNVYPVISITGNADFQILLVGTNVINTNHASGELTMSASRAPYGISANNTGALTITSPDLNADTLLIDAAGGVGIYKSYANLYIDHANVTIYMKNIGVDSGSNAQFGISMNCASATYADTTNLIVTNSILTITGTGKYLGNICIILSKGTSNKDADIAICTSDILFQNSKISLDRNNSSSVNSSGSEVIKYSSKSTCTIDRCDFYAAGGHRTARYAPAFTNCTDVQQRDGWKTWSEYTWEPGASLSANTNNSAFKATHICLPGEPVVEKKGDCAETADTVTYCTLPFCGKELSRESSEITDPAKIHTPGSKTLLSQTNAAYEYSSDSQKYYKTSPTGKYTYESTCSVCGASWTEEKEFKPATLYYITSGKGSYNSSSGDYNYTSYAGENTGVGYAQTLINPGTTKYFVTKANDDANPTNSYVVPLTDKDEIAAGNWNIKFEYPQFGDPVMTMKNANIINNTGLWYGFAAWRDMAPLTIVLEGQNSIKQTDGGRRGGPLMLQTNNSVTITGGGSLYLESWNSGKALATLNGDLILDNANITLVKTDTNTTSERDIAIGSTGTGNVMINGGTLTYVGFGRTTYKADGSANYSRTGYNNLIRGNNVTINGATITAHGTFLSKSGIIYATGDLTISESTLLLAHGFAYEVNATIYGDAFKCEGTATFNYANGVTGESSTGTTYVDKHVDYTTVTYPASVKAVTSVDDLKTIVTSSDYTRYLRIAPVKALEKFEGTAVTVEDDLTLEFAIQADKIPEGSKAYITRGENTTQITLTDAYKEGAYYIIPCTGIAAKEMHDQITVVIKDADGKQITETKTDSVYDYVVRMLKGEKPEDMSDAKFAALKTILVDMLNYGTMAQVQFNHNTENLANKVLTPTEWAYASAEMTAATATPATTNGIKHLGTTFELNNSISMLIAVEGEATAAKVYVDGEYKETVNGTAGDGYTIFTFNSLNAADGRKEVKFEINGDANVTVTDSLAAYVGRNIETYSYLENLMKYCDAAAAYFTAE